VTRGREPAAQLVGVPARTDASLRGTPERAYRDRYLLTALPTGPLPEPRGDRASRSNQNRPRSASSVRRRTAKLGPSRSTPERDREGPPGPKAVEPGEFTDTFLPAALCPDRLPPSGPRFPPLRGRRLDSSQVAQLLRPRSTPLQQPATRVASAASLRFDSTTLLYTCSGSTDR